MRKKYDQIEEEDRKSDNILVDEKHLEISDTILPVVNLKGEKVSEVNLPSAFSNQEINKILLKEVVVFYQQVKKRAGTAKTKNRSEVAGSTRKVLRQKGTGRARQGMRNPVHHRGGSVAFGPNGAKYNPSINKKKIKKALAILISEKIQNNNFIILNEMTLSSPKTKDFLTIAKNIKIDKGLFVDQERNNNFYLSLRNIIGFNHILVEGINPLDIMRAPKLVVSLDAFEALRKRYE